MANEFRLTKQEIADRDLRLSNVKNAFEELQAGVEQYNQEVLDLQESVTTALEAYNEALQDVAGFYEDIVSVNQERFDDKSEKWQEGERAGEVQSWIDSLQLSLDGITVDFPEPVEVEIDGNLEELEQASDSA